MLQKFIRRFASTAKNVAIKDFPLSVETISKLRGLGVVDLFPIQQECLKPILDGQDVVAQAKTGTGKTFAFAIPLIERLQSEDQLDKLQLMGRKPRVLTLAPTRELANQTATTFSNLVSYGGLKILPVYGGTAIQPQSDALSRGVDIIVGAPGRIKDLMERGVLSLDDVRHVVLDEVDRMLDMGFVNDVDDIIKGIYDNNVDRPQTMLFSATLPNWISSVSRRYLDANNTKYISFEDDTMTPENVRHIGLKVVDRMPMDMTLNACISQFLPNENSRCIVFCERKVEADKLAVTTRVRGSSGVLHGDLSQRMRDNVLKRFRSGNVNVLFTTDVAARGLDIPEVDLVVQMAPPQDIEAYVHRSGRTGRAGKPGVSVCMYSPNNRDSMSRIQEVAGIQFEKEKIDISAAYLHAAETTIEKLKAIPEEKSAQFGEMAKKLIDELGAEEAVKRALAHFSGQGDVNEVSLLSNRKDFIAMELSISNIDFAPRKSLLFNLLERAGIPIAFNIDFVRFTEGRQSIVFDVAKDAVGKLSRFKDSERFKLKPLTAKPVLEEPAYGNHEDRRSFAKRPRTFNDRQLSVKRMREF